MYSGVNEKIIYLYTNENIGVMISAVFSALYSGHTSVVFIYSDADHNRSKCLLTATTKLFLATNDCS